MDRSGEDTFKDIDFSKYHRRVLYHVVSLLRYRSFPIIRLLAKNNEVKRSDRSILINDFELERVIWDIECVLVA